MSEAILLSLETVGVKVLVLFFEKKPAFAWLPNLLFFGVICKKNKKLNLKMHLDYLFNLTGGCLCDLILLRESEINT